VLRLLVINLNISSLVCTTLGEHSEYLLKSQYQIKPFWFFKMPQRFLMKGIIKDYYGCKA